MKRKFIQAVAGCLTAAVLFSMPVFAQPKVSAESAVLLDGTTGRVLYAHNPDAKSLIASTTKIMTALLIAEECDLEASYRVPKEATGIEGSGIYLQPGETLTVETLLYGLMLHSGNDAAVALALYNCGNLPDFAEKMNRKAAELGLCNTNFVNPNGLDDPNHYSTAMDLAKLTAAAMENDVFRKVVSTKQITFGERTFTNHNKLLWSYEGAVGVKTGYTKAAGRILVSSAERDGRRLIAVTIRDRNDWADHTALLDYGFLTYSVRKVGDCGQTIAEIPIFGGAEATVQAVLREDVLCSMAENENVVLSPNLPMFVFAPALAGEQAGTISVLIDGKNIKDIPIFWKYSVLEGA